jgi:glutamine synthetase
MPARTCSTPVTTRTERAQFLAFLVGRPGAASRPRRTLIRAGIADAGKRSSAGRHEAPPAIISIFLGSQLTDVVEHAD